MSKVDPNTLIQTHPFPIVPSSSCRCVYSCHKEKEKYVRYSDINCGVCQETINLTNVCLSISQILI